MVLPVRQHTHHQAGHQVLQQGLLHRLRESESVANTFAAPCDTVTPTGLTKTRSFTDMFNLLHFVCRQFRQLGKNSYVFFAPTREERRKKLQSPEQPKEACRRTWRKVVSRTCRVSPRACLSFSLRIHGTVGHRRAPFPTLILSNKHGGSQITNMSTRAHSADASKQHSTNKAL